MNRTNTRLALALVTEQLSELKNKHAILRSRVAGYRCRIAGLEERVALMSARNEKLEKWLVIKS